MCSGIARNLEWESTIFMMFFSLFFSLSIFASVPLTGRGGGGWVMSFLVCSTCTDKYSSPFEIFLFLQVIVYKYFQNRKFVNPYPCIAYATLYGTIMAKWFKEAGWGLGFKSAEVKQPTFIEQVKSVMQVIIDP